MGTTTIRVSGVTRDKLRELSARSGQPLSAVVDRAVEALRREQLFDRFDAAYSRVQADTGALAELAAERVAWDRALGDGLDIG